MKTLRKPMFFAKNQPKSMRNLEIWVRKAKNQRKPQQNQCFWPKNNQNLYEIWKFGFGLTTTNENLSKTKVFGKKITKIKIVAPYIM